MSTGTHFTRECVFASQARTAVHCEFAALPIVDVALTGHRRNHRVVAGLANTRARPEIKIKHLVVFYLVRSSIFANPGWYGEYASSVVDPEASAAARHATRVHVHCVPEQVSAEILVLDGTAGAGRMAPPASTRVSSG